MNEYCKSCGAPIPSGQRRLCSMCVGDIDHGRDGYYRREVEEWQREQEQEQELGYADNGNTIVECWQCGGEGEISSCYEEWACLYPEEGCDLCLRPCDICDGKGSYEVPPKEKANENEAG